MFTKDGLGIIVGTFIFFILSMVVWYFFPHSVSLGVMVLFGIFSVFNLFFFRDPERNIPQNPLAVLSPADGKVLQIIKIKEPDYFDAEVYRVSIFLSVFNVHVNRTPISGKVDYFAYHTGKFLAAFKNAASSENEQTVIGMVDKYGHRVLFKQIAGLIARRIVCHLREGEWQKAGQRMGMIRYGSRVDVFLPFGIKMLVREGQSVKGGESVLAMFSNNGDFTFEEETLLEVPESEITT